MTWMLRNCFCGSGWFSSEIIRFMISAIVTLRHVMRCSNIIFLSFFLFWTKSHMWTKSHNFFFMSATPPFSPRSVCFLWIAVCYFTLGSYLRQLREFPLVTLENLTLAQRIKTGNCNNLQHALGHTIMGGANKGTAPCKKETHKNFTINASTVMKLGMSRGVSS